MLQRTDIRPLITTGDFYIIKKVGKIYTRIFQKKGKREQPSCSTIGIGVPHKFFLPLRIQASLDSSSPLTN
jgi:hypothetical protein